jgi:hypothetical protein
MKGEKMILKLISKIITLPIRTVNLVVKTGQAFMDASMAIPIRFEKNALDDIANGIEKEIGGK